MEKTSQTALEPHLQDLYVNAVLSGDLNRYEPDQESTHPFFDESIHRLKIEELILLFETLEKHITTTQQQLDTRHKKINWHAETWTIEEGKNWLDWEKLRVDLERLWHLRIILLELLNRRANRFIAHSAKNLEIDLDVVLKLKRDHGEAVVVVLGAGWFGKQVPAEA